MVWLLKHERKYLHVFFKMFYKSVHPARTYAGAFDRSRSVRSCILKGSWNNFFLSFLLFFRSLSFYQCFLLRKGQSRCFQLVGLIWWLVSCCSQCSGRSFDNNQCLCSCTWKMISLQVYLLICPIITGVLSLKQEVVGGRCDRKSPCIKKGNVIRWNAYP